MSASRLLLAWSVAIGVVPLPKSGDAARQAQNLDVFGIELTDDELGRLASLSRGGGADPETHEEL